MTLKLLCVLFLVALVSSQPNYQERCIYYSENDNACRNGKDLMHMIVNIDDKDRMKRTVDGDTMCSTWFIRYADAISASPYMTLFEYDEGTKIDFKQVATRKHILGILSSLTQKVTVQNPAKINGKNYNCTIFGDGLVQHFGYDIGHDPAEIYLRCLSIGNDSSESQEPKQKNLKIE